MNTTEPPARASQLLKRLIPGEDHDVLLGDLHEEYRRGRSRLWYWFQIATAIVVGTLKDIRTHKLAALSVSALGIVWLLLASPALLQGLIEVAKLWHWTYRSPGFAAAYKTIDLGSSVALGWLIVRLSRARGITMVVAYCGFMMVTVCVVFLWYATLAALGTDSAVFHSVAAQFQTALTHQLAHATLMFAGGCLATRQPESV